MGVMILALALLGVPACGGGGGGGSVAPAALVYSQGAVMYRTDATIAPNLPQLGNGSATTWSIQPALPAGLSLDPATGVISGMPLAPAPNQTYTVTAANADGSVQGTLDIEIRWAEHKSLAPKGSLSDADIRFFLDRTHFGFVESCYDSINTNGMDSYLDTALASINDTATTTLETEAEGFVDDLQFPGHTELALWWLHILQNTPNPLQESLALHWHDHFACSSDVLDTNSRWWFFDHVNLWRHNAAGNLRDMILAMARDWSMLEYLDGRDSRANRPNENFAREFFELFCLGVDNGYTQDDIVAAAFVFSGYRRTFNGTFNEITWVPNEHSDEDRTVLGVLIPGVDNQAQDEYGTVVDITLAHTAPGETLSYASRWLVRSLLRRYCLEDPSQDLIDQLATQLEADNWNLTNTLKALFLSEAFYSAQAKAGFVKTPAEHMLGLIHATGMRVQLERGNIGFGFEAGLDDLLDDMGNRPSQPPVVDGWPEGEAWLSAQGMVDRANAIEFITSSSRDFQANDGFDVASLLPSPTATAAEVVASLALRLGVTLTPDEANHLVDYLNTDDAGSTTAEPFDATNPTHLDERVRGLVYVLGLHPHQLLR